MQTGATIVCYLPDASQAQGASAPLGLSIVDFNLEGFNFLNPVEGGFDPQVGDLLQLDPAALAQLLADLMNAQPGEVSFAPADPGADAAPTAGEDVPFVITLFGKSFYLTADYDNVLAA